MNQLNILERAVSEEVRDSKMVKTCGEDDNTSAGEDEAEVEDNGEEEEEHVLLDGLAVEAGAELFRDSGEEDLEMVNLEVGDDDDELMRELVALGLLAEQPDVSEPHERIQLIRERVTHPALSRLSDDKLLEVMEQGYHQRILPDESTSPASNVHTERGRIKRRPSGQTYNKSEKQKEKEKAKEGKRIKRRKKKGK